jgi:hypothetical protein
MAIILMFGFIGGMGFIAGVAWWFIATPQRGHTARDAISP